MDRFDGTAPTWRHPSLQPGQLQDLLFSCYRRFYSPTHILSTAIRSIRTETIGGLIPYLGHPLFSWFAAAKRMHPMSGGVGRVRRDCVSDYRTLRMQQFGFEQIPLPHSLQLSAADTELNRRVNIAI
jgi:hypothetical protein